MKRAMLLAFAGCLVLLGTALTMVDKAPAADSTATATGTASPGASPQASPFALGDAANGKALSAQCMACHSVDGKMIVGPTWKGLYGKTEELEGGEKVKVDDAYIAESIRDPMKKIVKGFPPSMIPYPKMTDQEIADIIAYIKSLSEATPSPEADE